MPKYNLFCLAYIEYKLPGCITNIQTTVDYQITVTQTRARMEGPAQTQHMISVVQVLVIGPEIPVKVSECSVP